MDLSFENILSMVNGFGLWAVFLYLYLDERKQHLRTREDGAEKLARIQADHMADLKEIAGMRRDLARVGSIVETVQAQAIHEPSHRV